MESIKNITSTDLFADTVKRPVQKPDDHSSASKERSATRNGTQSASTAGVNKESVDFGKLTEKINQYVRSAGTKLSFKYDERLSRPIIVVRDQETGEIIRQIPQEEMLTLVDKLNDKNGFLFRGRG